MAMTLFYFFMFVTGALVISLLAPIILLRIFNFLCAIIFYRL